MLSQVNLDFTDPGKIDGFYIIKRLSNLGNILFNILLHLNNSS
jgi:hypothetical protein